MGGETPKQSNSNSDAKETFETPGRPHMTHQDAIKFVQNMRPGQTLHANDRIVRILEAAKRNEKRNKGNNIEGK